MLRSRCQSGRSDANEFGRQHIAPDLLAQIGAIHQGGDGGATAQTALETAAETGAVGRLIEQRDGGGWTGECADLADLVEKGVVVSIWQANQEFLDRRDLLGGDATGLHEGLGWMIQVEPIRAGCDAVREFGCRQGRLHAVQQGVFILGEKQDLGHADQELDAGQFQVVARKADAPIAFFTQHFAVGEQTKGASAAIGAGRDPGGFKQVH